MREVLYHNGIVYYPYTNDQYLKVINKISPIEDGLRILREGEFVSAEKNDKMEVRFGRYDVYALVVSLEGCENIFPCVIVKTEDLVETLL